MAPSLKKKPAIFSFCDNEFKCVNIKDKDFAIVEWRVNGDIELCPNDVRMGDKVELLIPLGKFLRENPGSKCIDVDMSGLFKPNDCLIWDPVKCQWCWAVEIGTVLDPPNTGNNPTFCTDLSKFQEVIKDPETNKLYVPPEPKEIEPTLDEILHLYATEVGSQDKGSDFWLSNVAPADEDFNPETTQRTPIDQLVRKIENPADACYAQFPEIFASPGSHVEEYGAGPNDFEIIGVLDWRECGTTAWKKADPDWLSSTRQGVRETFDIGDSVDVADKYESSLPEGLRAWCNFDLGDGVGCIEPGKGIEVRLTRMVTVFAHTPHPQNRHQYGVAQIEVKNKEGCKA